MAAQEIYISWITKFVGNIQFLITSFLEEYNQLDSEFSNLCWKPWISSFSYIRSYKCMQNYPKPLDPM